MNTKKTHQMIMSVVIGGILGWAIGAAQLIVIGSWDLFYWAFMPLIPLYSAFGWALIGMIIGGSGLFAKPEVPAADKESREDFPAKPAA